MGVRRVDVEGVGEDVERLRIHRLDDDAAARLELLETRAAEVEHLLRSHVFDHLDQDHATERAVVDTGEGRQPVTRFDAQTLGARLRSQHRVELDTPGIDVVFGEQFEELTAAAADVEHGAQSVEALGQIALAFANLLVAARGTPLRRHRWRRSA